MMKKTKKQEEEETVTSDKEKREQTWDDAFEITVSHIRHQRDHLTEHDLTPN